MITRSKVLELQKIMREEFDFDISYQDAEHLASTLLKYFDILLRIKSRLEFGNSPGGVIDSSNTKTLDKGKDKN